MFLFVRDGLLRNVIRGGGKPSRMNFFSVNVSLV